MNGVFAKSVVCVRIPHHVGNFSSIFVVFMITVALPLSAGSMVMELYFFSVCRAILSPLLMLDIGSLAHLMVPLSSSAAISVMYFATTSVPAMISLTWSVVGIMAKFKPLLSIDCSSSMICLLLRFITHLFVSVTLFLV